MSTQKRTYEVKVCDICGKDEREVWLEACAICSCDVCEECYVVCYRRHSRIHKSICAKHLPTELFDDNK